MARFYEANRLRRLSDGLPTSHFNTPQSTASERHEAWIAQGWPSIARLCEFERLGDFAANSQTVLFDPLRLTTGTYGAQEVHRTRGLIRTAPVDHLLVTIPLDVVLSTPSGQAGVNSVLVLDLAQEWRHRAPPGAMITLPIPRSLALNDGVDPSRVHGTIIPPASGRSIVHFVQRVMRDAHATPIEQAPALSDTIVKLLAVGLADAGRAIKPSVAAYNTRLRQKAEQLIQALLKSDKLTVAHLADTLSVSRAQLYRLFAQEDGLRRIFIAARLHAAADDMEVTSQSIAEIAQQYQFREYSHFSRSFLAEFGMRPTEWRAHTRT